MKDAKTNRDLKAEFKDAAYYLKSKIFTMIKEQTCQETELDAEIKKWCAIQSVVSQYGITEHSTGGKTFATFAAYHANALALRVLNNNGFDMEAADKEEETPEDYAYRGGTEHEECRAFFKTLFLPKREELERAIKILKNGVPKDGPS